MTTERTQPPMGGDARKRSLWLKIALILALAGIGISLYATLHHIEVKATGQTDAACNINESFSCDDVALSAYSEIAGIPLGIFGLGYFVALVVLIAMVLAGSKTAKDHMYAYATMVLIGVVVSVVMAIISITQVGAYCVSCIGIYAICLAQLGLLLAMRGGLPGGFNAKGLVSAGVNAALVVAAVVAVFNLVRPAAPSGPGPEVQDALPTLSQAAAEIPIAKSAYVGLGEDYRKGGDNAAVVIQEFVDFQCPACQRVSQTMEALHREYGDKILIVFRNYPLDSSCNSAVQSRIHEHACKAAVMARCAGQYGKFWQYHDLIFGNQHQINATKLKEWGRQVGLTDDQINLCWDSGDIMAKIREDVALGNQLGVDATPTLFINGRKVLGGRGLNDLRAEIDALLN